MSKLRNFLIVLLIVSLLPLVCSCSKNAGNEVSGANNQGDTSSNETNIYTIKFGHSNEPTEESWFHMYALKFKELTEEYSNNKIKVDIYPSNQLGDEQEQMRSISLGTQEAMVGASNNFNNYSPSLGFFTLPYIFDTTEEARQVIDAMLPELQKRTVQEANTRLLGITDAGFRVLTNSKKPVKNLQDLKSLRIRVAQNPIMIESFKAWGISPIPIAWAETFTALQQGVADGQDNCYNAILATRMYEVQKYITEIDYLIQTNVIILSDKFYQSLPDDLKEAVDKAGKETVEYARKITDESLVEDKENLKQKGMEIFGPPIDKEDWVKNAKSIWPQFYETIGGGDAKKGEKIINTVLEYKEKIDK